VLDRIGAMFDHRCNLHGSPVEDLMSHTEYASRPFPVFTQLARMLRNLPVVKLVVTKFVALLRNDSAIGELPIGKFLDDSRVGTGINVDQPIAILKSTGDIVVAAIKPIDVRSEREELIRRRWAETGVRLWNPNLHGAGLAALGIQGRVELLPPNPGEMQRRYDRLEFELIEGRIVCEGVVVDPPKRRR
jgi:hypothetical protein